METIESVLYNMRASSACPPACVLVPKVGQLILGEFVPGYYAKGFRAITIIILNCIGPP